MNQNKTKCINISYYKTIKWLIIPILVVYLTFTECCCQPFVTSIKLCETKKSLGESRRQYVFKINLNLSVVLKCVGFDVSLQ